MKTRTLTNAGAPTPRNTANLSPAEWAGHVATLPPGHHPRVKRPKALNGAAKPPATAPPPRRRG